MQILKNIVPLEYAEQAARRVQEEFPEATIKIAWNEYENAFVLEIIQPAPVDKSLSNKLFKEFFFELDAAGFPFEIIFGDHTDPQVSIKEPLRTFPPLAQAA